MVVKRKINLGIYFMVGFLTLLIFLLGVTMGIVIDNIRLQSATLTSEEKELDYTSLQFQYLYLSTLENTNESCGVFQATLENSLRELSESFEKIESYEEESNINKQEYQLILRKYILDNLRYWLFAQRTKKLCQADTVNILYFYSGKYCDICPNQGVILTYFKKLFGERLLVFPIDTDFSNKEQSIYILMGKYNITSYPSIILENEKYEGVVSKEELGRLICDSFIHYQPECASFRK